MITLLSQGKLDYATNKWFNVTVASSLYIIDWIINIIYLIFVHILHYNDV